MESKYTINKNNINIPQFHQDLLMLDDTINVKFSNEIQNLTIIHTVEKTIIDSVISNHDSTDDITILIKELSSVIKPDFRNINWDKELITGVRLHKKREMGIGGQLKTVYLYKNYDKDTKTFSDVVIKSESFYTYDETVTDIPAARNIVSRRRIRSFMQKNGKWSPVTQEIPEKFYTNDIIIRNEGRKRRNNIIVKVSKDMITGLILTGNSPNKQDAINKLSTLMFQYDSALNTYKEGGAGTIYQDITDDTTPWLDTIVHDSPTTQALIPDMIGFSLKTHIVDMLKGLK